MCAVKHTEIKSLFSAPQLQHKSPRSAMHGIKALDYSIHTDDTLLTVTRTAHSNLSHKLYKCIRAKNSEK